MPRDDAFDDPPRARAVRSVERAEAQRVQQRDRAGAHREDVADDAADAGGRALVRLDEGRMIVRLDLEDRGEAVADVDRAGVLARPLQDARPAGRQLLQVDARALVAAVLRPHHREDAELGLGRLALQRAHDAVVFVGGEAVAFELLPDRCVMRFGPPPRAPARGRPTRDRTRPSALPSDAFARALGMRHQADDVASFAADAGDVAERPVRVGRVRQLARLVAVAEDDAPRRLELADHIGLRVVVPFAVRDRQSQPLPGAGARRERRVGLLDADDDVLAVKLQVTIAQHRAGQQPGLEQNLKAVADAEHRPAAPGEIDHRRHDRREPRDRAGAQVVAVREPAGQDHHVGALEARSPCARRTRRPDRARASRRGTRRGRSWNRERRRQRI